MAIVLVQVLRDTVQVHLYKCLTYAVVEFNLWGIRIGHWDEAIGGGFLCGSRGKPDPQTPGLYIVHLRSQSLGFTWDHLTIQQRRVIRGTYET